MILEVKEWLEQHDYHQCLDEEGNSHNVDLLVDGSLPEEYGYEPNKLVGKKVEVVHMHAYISIAYDVSLID